MESRRHGGHGEEEDGKLATDEHGWTQIGREAIGIFDIKIRFQISDCQILDLSDFKS
jgi:hypothetical protein